MRKPGNPFIITGYHSPAYFCDRQEELSWLVEQFDNERNMVLFAWRRLGKTALVHHFFYHLEKHHKADTVFVDLLGTANLSDAHKRIVNAILNKFGDLQKGIGAAFKKLLSSLNATIGFDPLTGAPQLTVGHASSQMVAASFDTLGAFLSERKQPVIICIDEFQQIVEYPEHGVESMFRTWMQNFPMLRFVFSGSHRHMMVSMFSDKSRPFYRSAQILPIDALDQVEYSKFIRAHFKKSGKIIDEAIIEFIFSWTKMLTYYVQLVCNHLYARGDSINAKALSEVFETIIQQYSHQFQYYQQLFTSFQWKLLSALAKEEEVKNPLAKEFIFRYQLGAASSVNTALKALTKKEFVIHHDGIYSLQDPLFMRWLQKI